MNEDDYRAVGCLVTEMTNDDLEVIETNVSIIIDHTTQSQVIISNVSQRMPTIGTNGQSAVLTRLSSAICWQKKQLPHMQWRQKDTNGQTDNVINLLKSPFPTTWGAA